MNKIVKKTLVTLLIFFILISVTGCSFSSTATKGISNSESFIFGQDDQYYFTKQIASGLSMAESEDGYYFISGTENSYLYFLDKKTMQVQILCNKPDCLHADEPDPKKITYCNAFLNITNANIIYYGQKLYLLDSFSGINSGYGLYQASLDGTQRKKIYTFKVQPTCLIIHRGYIYYTTADNATMSENEETTATKSELYRINLSDLNKKPELIYKIDGFEANISRLIGYKNTVYFSYTYFQDSSLQSYTGALMDYNIINSKVAMVKQDVGNYSICGDYFAYYWAGKIYRCNMDGTNEILLDHVTGIPLSCKNYILTDTFNKKISDKIAKRQLIVYDLNGEKITSVDIDTINISDSVYGCSDEIIFTPDNSSQKNQFGNIRSLWTINLKDVSTGKLSLMKVFEFVPKVDNNGVETKLN